MTADDHDDRLPTLSLRATVPDHVVYRAFVHETVILNLRTGRYHGLNPTGGRMLELLEEHSLGGAAERLAEEYARPLPEVERDVREFCGQLAERGLIEMSANGRH